MRHLASHWLTWGLAGFGLGYLVGLLLVDHTSALLPWDLDASSWASGFPGALGGLLGGGAAGAAPKGGGLGNNAGGSPSGSPGSGPSQPPILRNPPDSGLPPGLAEEDETSYGMFDGIHDFLGKVLGETYDEGQKNFKKVQGGGDWLGTSDTGDDK